MHPALHSSACMHTGYSAISAVPFDCQLIFGRRGSWQHCCGRWQSTLRTGKGLADDSATCTALLCLQHDRAHIASVRHNCTVPRGRHLHLVLRLKNGQIAAYRQGSLLHTLCGRSLRYGTRVNSASVPLQAAALRRRRAMQRQVLYIKPVTAEAGKPVQASSSPMTCLG